MNHLNSVLIEGTVMHGASSPDDDSFHFHVNSIRFEKIDQGVKKIEQYFEIRAYGGLAAVCRDSCLPDRTLRVSGRLENSLDGHVFIRAEHVEFKDRL